MLSSASQTHLHHQPCHVSRPGCVSTVSPHQPFHVIIHCMCQLFLHVINVFIFDARFMLSDVLFEPAINHFIFSTLCAELPPPPPPYYPLLSLEVTTPQNKINYFDAVITYARKPVSQGCLSRIQLSVHATRRTPLGASPLVQAMPAWSVKTRRAPSGPVSYTHLTLPTKA